MARGHRCRGGTAIPTTLAAEESGFTPSPPAVRAPRRGAGADAGAGTVQLLVLGGVTMGGYHGATGSLKTIELSARPAAAAAAAGEGEDGDGDGAVPQPPALASPSHTAVPVAPCFAPRPARLRENEHPATKT